MGDEVSILPQWKRLQPAEKVGNSKESLVGQIEREIPQWKKRRRKPKGGSPETDQETEAGTEEISSDPETQSGKIVDVVI